jgi:dolichyl-phosphate-mannose-protein mannosyltransferase
MLFAAVASYIASWSGWILGDDGWGRQAEDSWWESLWAYHQNAYTFHTNLDSEHPYQANAFEWLLSLRPTAFFFERYEDSEVCGALGNCTVAITAIPNLVTWFAGLTALLWLLRQTLRLERAALLVVGGFLAAWLPWVFYLERTVFQFYTVVMVPFMILGLTLGLHHYWRRGVKLGWQAKRESRILILLLAVVLTSVYFFSIWTGNATFDWVWRIQMLFPFWV